MLATMTSEPDPAFARTLRWVVFLNAAYFLVEFTVASRIGSVSLFADSVDFLEDSLMNLLILSALAWPARRRAMMGLALAGLLLVPSVAALWTAGEKFLAPVPPAPLPLSLTGLGALAVNVCCAWMLVRFRAYTSSLARAAFLSARNDVLANVAILMAGGATALTRSAWPDLAVGLAIALMNSHAAVEVYRLAIEERRGTSPPRP